MATLATTAEVRPASKAGRFDQVSIGFHWLTLALIVGQLTTAFLFVVGEAGPDAANILTVHRSTGIVVWFIAAARLVWRLRFAHKPPFPASLPKLQQATAKANEYGLYALLLIQPLTGLGDTVFRGRPFQFAVWRIPALMPADKPVFHAMHLAHELGAAALLGLIALHAGAALFHGVVLRDGVLQRMLPWTER